MVSELSGLNPALPSMVPVTFLQRGALRVVQLKELPVFRLSIDTMGIKVILGLFDCMGG